MEDAGGEQTPLHPCNRKVGGRVPPNQPCFSQWQCLQRIENSAVVGVMGQRGRTLGEAVGSGLGRGQLLGGWAGSRGALMSTFEGSVLENRPHIAA